VADESDAGDIEAAQQRGEIGDMAVEAVRVFPRRFLREPEADHVGDDHAVPRPGERGDEIAIKKAPGRIAVQQHDRIAAALVHVVHAPAVHAGKARLIRPLRADGVGKSDHGLRATNSTSS
jgi:hypothetical protein